MGARTYDRLDHKHTSDTPEFGSSKPNMACFSSRWIVRTLRGYKAITPRNDGLLGTSSTHAGSRHQGKQERSRLGVCQPAAHPDPALAGRLPG
jgi:hypothetical protein